MFERLLTLLYRPLSIDAFSDTYRELRWFCRTKSGSDATIRVKQLLWLFFISALWAHIVPHTVTCLAEVNLMVFILLLSCGLLLLEDLWRIMVWVSVSTIAEADSLWIVVDVVYCTIEALSFALLVHALVAPGNDYICSLTIQYVLQCFRIGLSLLIYCCTHIMNSTPLARSGRACSGNCRP